MVLAGQAVLRNYHSQQETASLKAQLASVQVEKLRLQALLVYYNSDSYKEKELRRTLLMKKPTEKMYALPESSLAKTVEEDLPAGRAVAASDSLPIWRQWVEYVLHGS